jgi:hypothetical protein
LSDERLLVLNVYFVMDVLGDLRLFDAFAGVARLVLFIFQEFGDL